MIKKININSVRFFKEKVRYNYRFCNNYFWIVLYLFRLYKYKYVDKNSNNYIIVY